MSDFDPKFIRSQIGSEATTIATRLITGLSVDDTVGKKIQGRLEKVIGDLIEEGTVTGTRNKSERLVGELRKLSEENSLPIDIDSVALKREILGIDNFTRTHKSEVNNLAKNDLKAEIVDQIIKTNPGANKKVVDDYAELVAEMKHPEKKNIDIDEYIESAEQSLEEQGVSPGKIATGENKLNELVDVVNYVQKPKELVSKYKELVANIGGKVPTGVKECQQIDEAVKMISESPKLEQLMTKAQKVFGVKDNLWFKAVSKIGGDKLVMGVAEKVLGTVGMEFTRDALAILSQTTLERGSVIILQSFFSGGSGALSVAAATVTAQSATAAVGAAQAALATAQATLTSATASGVAASVATATAGVETATAALATAQATAATATAAATAATASAGAAATAAGTAAAMSATIPVVGWIVAGAIMAYQFLLKPLFKKIRGVIQDLGLDLGIKNFLQDTFGKFFGGVLNFVLKTVGILMAIPTLVIGGSATVILTPVIIGVFVFIFGYQMMQGDLVSTIVPPVEEPLTSEDTVLGDGGVTGASCAGGVLNLSNIYDPVDISKIKTRLSKSEYSYKSNGNIDFSCINALLPEKLTHKRSDILKAAYALLGVPYWMGGGHGTIASGVSSDWGKRVSPPGSGWNEGRRYHGLDCSGFVRWVYMYVTGTNVGSLSKDIYSKSEKISKSGLKPGDIGFLYGKSSNHIGLFLGKGINGKYYFIHDAGRSSGVGPQGLGGVYISAANFTHFGRIKVNLAD